MLRHLHRILNHRTGDHTRHTERRAELRGLNRAELINVDCVELFGLDYLDLIGKDCLELGGWGPDYMDTDCRPVNLVTRGGTGASTRR